MIRLLASLLALGVAAPAVAGEAVLSDGYGRPMTVGALEDARAGWAAAEIAPDAAVALFAKLCLASADEASFVAAAEAAGLERADADLPAAGKAAAVTVTMFRGAGLMASYWAGDAASLAGRASAIRDRGVVITGPVSAKRLAPKQCNLSMRTTGLASAEPLSSALTSTSGVQPAKLVLKPGFADGNWTLAGAAPRTLTFSAVDLKKPEQLVHLSVFSSN